ncbi:MAG TPA: hypothetical protein VF171_08900 [Trueperaceae bacterium]
MFHADFVFRLGQQRAHELQQQGRRAKRAAYPDRERRPRILRHWANRF